MEDRCICCGRIIPEGLMVCPICDKSDAEEILGYDYDGLTAEEERMFLKQRDPENDYE